MDLFGTLQAGLHGGQEADDIIASAAMLLNDQTHAHNSFAFQIIAYI